MEEAFWRFRLGAEVAGRLAREEGLPVKEVERQAREGAGPLWERRPGEMALVREGLQVLEELLEANAPLVEWHLRRRGVPEALWKDLFAAGIEGLYRALSRYDPGRGAFSTYAVHWVRQAVDREWARLNPGPSMGVRRRREAFLSGEVASFSLDDPVPGMEEAFYRDEVEDPFQDPWEAAWKGEVRRRVGRALERLPPREAKVARAVMEGLPLEAVAREEGVTRQAVGHVWGRAKRRLRGLLGDLEGEG